MNNVSDCQLNSSQFSRFFWPKGCVGVFFNTLLLSRNLIRWREDRTKSMCAMEIPKYNLTSLQNHMGSPLSRVKLHGALAQNKIVLTYYPFTVASSLWLQLKNVLKSSEGITGGHMCRRPFLNQMLTA